MDDIEEGVRLSFLEDTLKIPRQWIYEAKALRARHAGDHLLEAEYLISADAHAEAHRTILQQVAPVAIISGNRDNLKKILAKFDPSTQPEGWGLGGQVYLDFIRLKELENASSEKSKVERRDIARRLLGTLKNMERKGFLQNIAVREMSGDVGSLVVKENEMVSPFHDVHVRCTANSTNQAGEKFKVLELPLTEDEYLKKTVNLSLEYFKSRLQSVSVQ